MKTKSITLFVTWGLLGLAVALLVLVAAPTHAAPAAVLTVCPAGLPVCDYSVIQDAVDAANGGDVIKVATGVYTHVNNYDGLAQVVYISKTVTLRGGYAAPGFTEPPDPEANPTTLDAQGQGRVLYITGNISPTIEGLRLTGGDAGNMGGHPWGYSVGGGLYILDATVIISNSEAFSNTATWGSGLASVYGDISVNGSLFATNEGGGICLIYATAALNDNVISGNTSVGGLRIDYGTIILESGEFA